MAKKSANVSAFKKNVEEAKKIWNDPKRPKSIKTFADAIKAASKKNKK